MVTTFYLLSAEEIIWHFHWTWFRISGMASQSVFIYFDELFINKGEHTSQMQFCNIYFHSSQQSPLRDLLGYNVKPSLEFLSLTLQVIRTSRQGA